MGQTPQLKIRMPADLLAWVKAEAERNGASQNSEIVRAVRERMERMKASDAKAPAA